MDHRLKLVKFLIKKVSLGETVDFSSMPVFDTEKKKTPREKELEFYEKLKKSTPDGWDFEVLAPGKEADGVRPDIFFTRKSDGKKIKVEAKSLSSSKHVRVGCTNTLSFSCSGTSAHEGIKGLASANDPSPSGSRRWPIKKDDEDQMKQWQEYAAEVSRKSDIHIIGNDDEIHLVWPHEDESNVPEHISDFLNSTGLQITHFIQHVTKSGNPVHHPAESGRGERVYIRARLSQGKPSSSEETFSSQNARQIQLITSKNLKQRNANK